MIDSLSERTVEVIPFDDEETERILSLELSPQEEALIHTLLTTAMRPGELRNLQPAGIMEDTLVLDGKTGIDRIPVMPEVRDLLLQIAGTNYVFENVLGKPLSQEAVYRMIEDILLRANVREGKGGARLFRHTALTRAQEDTGDPFFVQRLARHASLAMTRRYAHIALRSTIKKYRELDLLRRPQQPEASTPPAAAAEPLKETGEAEPFPVDGAVQMPMDIPGLEEPPTGPYIIKEYAYRTFDQELPDSQGYPLRCWRILGANGAFYPTTGHPKNFLSFDEAQDKLRDLWNGGEK
ncbi:Tyrosine recombinase XerH [subsurface metagenome]